MMATLTCLYDKEEAIVLNEMRCRLEEVTQNYKTLLEEWKKFQEVLQAEEMPDVPQNYVLVHKDDLSKLATETSQLKQNLPRILTKQVTTAVASVDTLQGELDQMKTRCQELEAEKMQWRRRVETASSECQKEKEMLSCITHSNFPINVDRLYTTALNQAFESLHLRCELQQLSDQLLQQSDFCSSLGSACCTLLWRVSRSEDSVQAILGGTKIDEFLGVVSSTLESYLSAYKDDWPQEQSDESSFILAIVGIITNIAASAYGRDFLISRDGGRHLVDTFITFLSEAPLGKSARLKNLILMSLYNLSINQKAIKYICSKQGIMGLLAWHLQEETNVDNRLNTLRLIQSLISDETTPTVVHQIVEVLPEQLLQELTTDKNGEVQKLALELIMDLRQVNSEQ